ncbi:MAG: molybdopterin-dependent oxidoreductase [Gammaproteobacteria bacterium]|jgi:anaerobic selenocysteine-containing dehydrogenase
MPQEHVNAKREIIAISDVDSHSQCRMRVTVENERVTQIAGDPTDPECRGQLTVRGEHMLDVLYAPDRLKTPLRRTGPRGSGKWEAISWDSALDEIAARLRSIKSQHGAEAVDFHHGHYHSGQLLDVFLSRLANLLGTPNVSNPSHICLGPRAFTQITFDFGIPAPPDIPNTACLILWGGNPEVSNKGQALQIESMRARGGKLIVIDPRVTDYARTADLYAQPRPGTDGALALGMLHHIVAEHLYDAAFVEDWTVGFDKLRAHLEGYPPSRVSHITGVPAQTIRDIAELYATTKPSCISPRNALDEHTNAACAIRAIDFLMALTGNLDVRGGNVLIVPLSLGFADLRLTAKLPFEMAEKRLGADRVLYARMSQFYPAAHTPTLWSAITDDEPYPVRALLVFAANPMMTHANTKLIARALQNLDFLVVTDFFMTATARLADIVLPACTFLERTRFVTYDTHTDHGWNAPLRIHLSQRVVAPLHESKPDWWIIWELGRRLGYGEYFPWTIEEEAIDDVLKPLGLDCTMLSRHPEGIMLPLPSILYQRLRGPMGAAARAVLQRTRFRDYPEMYRKYEGFMKGFRTPSGKVEFYSQQLADLGFDPLPVHREPAESPVSRPDVAQAYPLVLIAGSKLKPYTHAMMRNIPSLRALAPENVLQIHPEDAATRGIDNGTTVVVSSPRGEISCRTEVSQDIAPGVVHLQFGYEENNANILTDSGAYDPITGSTGLKSSLCEVRPADSS